MVYLRARVSAEGLPQKMKVPRLVDVTMSIAPSLFKQSRYNHAATDLFTHNVFHPCNQ